jgi:hypothetical protein
MKRTEQNSSIRDQQVSDSDDDSDSAALLTCRLAGFACSISKQSSDNNSAELQLIYEPLISTEHCDDFKFWEAFTSSFFSEHDSEDGGDSKH